MTFEIHVESDRPRFSSRFDATFELADGTRVRLPYVGTHGLLAVEFCDQPSAPIAARPRKLLLYADTETRPHVAAYDGPVLDALRPGDVLLIHWGH